MKTTYRILLMAVALSLGASCVSPRLSSATRKNMPLNEYIDAAKQAGYSEPKKLKEFKGYFIHEMRGKYKPKAYALFSPSNQLLRLYKFTTQLDPENPWDIYLWAFYNLGKANKTTLSEFNSLGVEAGYSLRVKLESYRGYTLYVMQEDGLPTIVASFYPDDVMMKNYGKINWGMTTLSSLKDGFRLAAYKDASNHPERAQKIPTPDFAGSNFIKALAANIDVGGMTGLAETIDIPERSWDYENIAILDLSSNDLKPNEAFALSEQLRFAVVDADYFQVLSSQDVETILKQQEFQRSGACDETSCLVEIGRVLSVTKIIGGSLGKIGDSYTIALRLVDVETGQIQVAASNHFKGEPDQLIIAVKVTARKLLLEYQKKG